ncbi:Rrf2 family transcriptional regulator [Roseobacter sp. YSTF-M11]|uniref:Rrf2 family transcriptional regulator n=1 Tax=Roseobacter insulae TaxID=2859783 RepID=A0A9X1K2D4_9RHOB|nr:Rrf2 family transcriptional regulator [Roseobacter insulae]MBW4707457.1 Rrf2 family transcriptional regulator [Roseobacter insulae]
MQLSKFTDYALRTLMHLAVAEGHILTTRQIAEIHQAKYNHLAKVTQWLVREGYVVSVRGRTGGIRLAKPTSEINIGRLVQKLESQSELVECMRADGGNCILAPKCGLTGALIAAQDAFYASLGQLTLDDLSNKNPGMHKILSRLNAG